MKDVQIAYIGGGSRGWAWGLMSDLASQEALSGTVRLYDIDAEAAKSNEIIGNRLSERDDVNKDWTYELKETLQEALVGADFVIISILPGTFVDMESDVHEPERYNIYQSVGDTVGPGGLFRALRTIPMYIEIAEAIKAYAPKAWVINFTNPMTICTQVLYRVFPEIKAFGNCHEVFGTQKLLVSALEHECDLEDIPREDVKVNVVGINHFTWFTKASYQDIDLFPVYQSFLNQYREEGYEKTEKGHWMNDHFSSAEKIKFDLFEKYGYIAAAGDRHLAEFCPGQWYLNNPETVKEWKFGLTPVSWRMENKKNLMEKSERLRSGEEAFEIKETGEEAVRQMTALVGLGEFVTNVNIPNQGQIGNLPLGHVVETNAVFRKDMVAPVVAGDIPLEIYGLIMPHVTNQEMIIESVFTKDKELAFKAFLNDPLMRLDYEKARELFNRMYDKTKKYLTYFE